MDSADCDFKSTDRNNFKVLSTFPITLHKVVLVCYTVLYRYLHVGPPQRCRTTCIILICALHLIIYEHFFTQVTQGCTLRFF